MAAQQHETIPTALQLSQECSDQALFQLSKKVDGYNTYKHELGLSVAEIEAIDLNPATFYDIPGRFYAALMKWKSKNINPPNSTATYNRLVEIFEGPAVRSIHDVCVEYTKQAVSGATGAVGDQPAKAGPSPISTSPPVMIDYSQSDCSNAYNTMVQCSVPLSHAMSKDPTLLAQALLGKGIITQSTVDEIVQLDEIKSAKGSRLYSAVVSEVRNFPKRFAVFVQILRQDGLLCDHVLTEMGRVCHL